MQAQLPDFTGGGIGGFLFISQSPAAVSIFYDTGQGQGWHRSISVDGSAHLPSSIRLWWGDSRAHWEGNTLVIDVTNFSHKTNYIQARENLCISSSAGPAPARRRLNTSSPWRIRPHGSDRGLPSRNT
jgi:hypothetical protein